MQESFSKTSTWALLTAPKALTVDHNKLWKILKKKGIPDQLTCLQRNLHVGKKATIRDRQNNELVPNWERSTSRLYIIILFI